MLIGAGAKLLGDITVGDNASIGANAVILHDVPAGATIVGVPGKVVKLDGIKTTKSHAVELDHTDVEDPLEAEIRELRQTIISLKGEIDDLKKQID